MCKYILNVLFICLVLNYLKDKYRIPNCKTRKKRFPFLQNLELRDKSMNFRERRDELSSVWKPFSKNLLGLFWIDETILIAQIWSDKPVRFFIGLNSLNASH